MTTLIEPSACRWCRVPKQEHMQRWTPRSEGGPGWHQWVHPTQEQIKARMIARRNARKSVCRCPLGDEWRPFAPVFDPYQCEADDCHGYTSETDPFGGGSYWRSVHTPNAEVSRRCGTCGWETSVWHVDDGSAEEELHRHVRRVHGGAS